MVINAYLNFNGNCKQAVEFYADVFGVKPQIMTFGEMPPDPAYPISDNIKHLIVHANIDICGNKLMFSDCTPDMEYICGNNISLSLSSKDKEQLTAWFNKLSEGGKIGVPLDNQFWSKLYGFVVDRFGIGWQVNCTE